MSSDAFALLDLWTTARNLAPPERAVALAANVGPEIDASILANQPLGERDVRLAKFHQLHGGPLFDATSQCPTCDANVDLPVSVEMLVASHREIADPPDPLTIDDRQVDWRPVTTNDLIAASATEDDVEAAELLVTRCLHGATADPDTRAALAHALADADPLAEVMLDTVCTECQAPFVAEIDIARHALATFERKAATLLADVDVLARRYGWTEAEILSVPAHRREHYLALAEAR